MRWVFGCAIMTGGWWSLPGLRYARSQARKQKKQAQEQAAAEGRTLPAEPPKKKGKKAKAEQPPAPAAQYQAEPPSMPHAMAAPQLPESPPTLADHYDYPQFGVYDPAHDVLAAGSDPGW
jgi:hypothetical protein